MLDEVAWWFNIRGSDVSFNPVVFAYAVVTLHHGIHIFINKTKQNKTILSPEVIQYLTSPLTDTSFIKASNTAAVSYDLTVHIHEYHDIASYLDDFVLKHPTFKMAETLVKEKKKALAQETKTLDNIT